MTDPLFRNPWVTVDTVAATTGTGTEYPHTRVTTPQGAVLIPFTRVNGIVKVGLVETLRPAVDRTLIEFPRGGTSDDSAAEALRELGEEFGLGEKVLGLPHRQIGSVLPDSGIVNAEIPVWAVCLPYALAHPTEGFREDETGGVVHWWTVDRLRSAIRSGEVQDGFTLSTLILAELSGVFEDLDH